MQCQPHACSHTYTHANIHGNMLLPVYAHYTHLSHQYANCFHLWYMTLYVMLRNCLKINSLMVYDLKHLICIPVLYACIPIFLGLKACILIVYISWVERDHKRKSLRSLSVRYPLRAAPSGSHMVDSWDAWPLSEQTVPVQLFMPNPLSRGCMAHGATLWHPCKMTYVMVFLLCWFWSLKGLRSMWVSTDAARTTFYARKVSCYTLLHTDGWEIWGFCSLPQMPSQFTLIEPL